jgi:AraC-like DNA-binding protein
VRAVEYIQDQLDTDLTVSGIAQTVSMSPYHFMRLFKESTGQSPHQYVIEARVRKAKELLTTGKFTISEAAHHVGFVDQSHLTRHFKRVFGMPPKTFCLVARAAFYQRSAQGSKTITTFLMNVCGERRFMKTNANSTATALEAME